MKTTFVGQKGAGKSTIASLLCRNYISLGRSVSVLDAGHVPELAKYLGVSAENAEAMKPPRGSVLADFAQDVDGVSLVVAGDCRLENTVLDRFLESVPFDSVAIVDADFDPDSVQDLGSFDEVIFVVEANDASVRSFKSVRARFEALGVSYRVIGNKIRGKYDAHFLLREVGDKLLTCLAHSDQLARDASALLTALEVGNQDALAIIERHLAGCNEHHLKGRSKQPEPLGAGAAADAFFDSF